MPKKMNGFCALSFINAQNKERFLKFFLPVCNKLSIWGIHPDSISYAGLIFSLFSGIFYAKGAFVIAGIWLILSGICDVLDGQVARFTGNPSRFGAFLDSTLDRFGEAFYFMGLAWFFAENDRVAFGFGSALLIKGSWGVILVLLSLSGSMAVSYTKARAEGLGVQCKVGLMQRPERMVLMILGSVLSGIPVLGPGCIWVTLLILAVTTHWTAWQRMVHVKNQMEQMDSK